jgi:RimJ/RimL family protein N-acetyltransferase
MAPWCHGGDAQNRWSDGLRSDQHHRRGDGSPRPCRVSRRAVGERSGLCRAVRHSVAGWVGFPEALPAAVDGARRRSEDPWGTHLFFDDDGALVGFGGFKGEPSHGEVELGYAVAPARQGRGVATAVVEQLVNRAHTAGVNVVRAHTLAEENASTAVLRKCGFVRTGQAHESGDDVWRWEWRSRRPNNPRDNT